MAQLRVQNRDNKVIKVGEYVKFAPNTRTGIVLTQIGDANIIGTAAEILLPERWGNVNLLNTVSLSDIVNFPEGLDTITQDILDRHSAMKEPTGFENRVDSS